MSLQNEVVLDPRESVVHQDVIHVPLGRSRQKPPVRIRFIVIQIHLKINPKLVLQQIMLRLYLEATKTCSRTESNLQNRKSFLGAWWN